MKTFKNAIIGGLALVVSTFFVTRTQAGQALAASIGSVFVTNDAARPVPVAAQADGLTHLRRRASAHVELRSGGANIQGSAVFRQVGSEGQPLVDAAHFDPLYGYKMPPGKVLVITDMVWSLTNATPGSSVGFTIYLWGGPGLEVGPYYEIFHSYGTPSGASFTDRIAIGAGLVIPAGRFIYANSYYFPSSEVYIYGYLADDV